MSRTVLAAIILSASLLSASLLSWCARVSAQPLFPERSGIVSNNTGISVSEARINSEFDERIGEPYDLEGAVILTQSCEPDPEVWLDLALVEYGLADRAGEIDNDTVAWLVCEEPRFVGFFYGSDNPYADQLDADAVANAMVADLQAQNFTGAVTSGLDVVAGDLAREAGAAAAPVSAGDDGGTGGAVRGVLLLGLLGAGGLLLWRNRSKKPEVAQAPAVPQPAHDLRVALADLDKRLTPDSNALAQLVLAYESMGDEAMLEVDRQHESMLARLERLHETATALEAKVKATEPTDEELAEWHEAPLAEADALIEYTDGLEAEAAHVTMLEEKAPVLAVEARKAIDAAGATYGAAVEGLELPSAARAFAFPSALVDEAEAALTAGQRITAGRLAEDATEIAERTGGLPGEVRAIDATIENAAEIFPRLERYAESSWSDVRGNGSEADESLDAAADMFARMLDAELEAYGTDPAAGYLASLEMVYKELKRARRLAESIRERLGFLQKAQEEAGRVIEDVGREIEEARAWLTQSDVDRDVTEAPEAELEKAEAMLRGAQLAMETPTPDWTAVLRAANEADRTADAALAGAQEQVERMAARRRALKSGRTEAEMAVDRAARFLSAHRSDASAEASSHVSDARIALRRAADRAENLADLEETALAEAMDVAIAGFQTARERADSAYEGMSGDVARADERRRDYQPRPSWMGPVVPIPMNPRSFPFPRGNWSRGVSRPRRKSSWGSRPSRGRSRVGGSSSRRGGGRGW